MPPIDIEQPTDLEIEVHARNAAAAESTHVVPTQVAEISASIESSIFITTDFEEVTNLGSGQSVTVQANEPMKEIRI